MLRRLSLVLALTACGGGGGGERTFDAQGSDHDAATDSSAVDAPSDSLTLAPTWTKRLPGIGASTSMVLAGTRLAVTSARVGGTGSLVIADGEPGQVTLTDIAQRPLLWLDPSNGDVVGGRVLAERTNAQVGGLDLGNRLVADGSDVLIGGTFVGQTRFFPGAAPRVEQAVVESASDIAHDPFTARFDATFAPSDFVRGTSTGTLTFTRFNDLTGLIPLASGTRMISGTRDTPQFAIAGSAVTTGATSYVAKLDASGQPLWVRSNTGGLAGPRLAPSGAGAYITAELSSDATLFAGAPGATTVTRIGGATALHGVIARVDGAGALTWLRAITTANGLNHLSSRTLADGRLLVSVTFFADAPYDIRDASGGVIDSGTAQANQTLLVWLASDGAVVAKVVVPWPFVEPVELASGDLASMVSWSADALPPELSSLTLPADITPSESTVDALVVLTASGTSLHVLGLNIWPTLAAIPGGVAVTSEHPAPPQPAEPTYLLGSDGAFVAEPACTMDLGGCLVVARYAVP